MDAATLDRLHGTFGPDVPVPAVAGGWAGPEDLWSWLVEGHGPLLGDPLLTALPPEDRVLLVLVDVRQHTFGEAVALLGGSPRELLARHDVLRAGLRLPDSLQPLCRTWFDVRAAHRFVDDEEHLAAIRDHLAGCLSCGRAAQVESRVRRWWLGRLGAIGMPATAGAFTALPAFAAAVAVGAAVAAGSGLGPPVAVVSPPAAPPTSSAPAPVATAPPVRAGPVLDDATPAPSAAVPDPTPSRAPAPERATRPAPAPTTPDRDRRTPDVVGTVTDAVTDVAETVTDAAERLLDTTDRAGEPLVSTTTTDEVVDAVGGTVGGLLGGG